MDARCATMAIGMRRRRASLISCPSLRRARVTGIGQSQQGLFSSLIKVNQPRAPQANPPNSRHTTQPRRHEFRLVSIVDKLTVVRVEVWNSSSDPKESREPRTLHEDRPSALHVKRIISRLRTSGAACLRARPPPSCMPRILAPAPRHSSDKLWSDLDGHRPQSEKAGRQQSAIAPRAVFGQCLDPRRGRHEN
jgi:hypothetical protein